MKTKTNTTKTTLAQKMQYSGVARVARSFGVSREHLSKVLHGKRRANDMLRRRLWRLGIVKTADGKEI